MLATKPATSPVIPPPTPIIKSDLLKFLDSSHSKNNLLYLLTYFFHLPQKIEIKEYNFLIFF